MAEQSKMVERTMECWSSVFPPQLGGRLNVADPQTVEKHLRDGLQQFVQWVAGRVKQGDQSYLEPEQVWSQFCGQYTDGEKVLKYYKQAYERHQSVRFGSRVEFWAAFKDRLQALVFRMATGIGIAAIILATGWLAQHWNIPIPLLRIVP